MSAANQRTIQPGLVSVTFRSHSAKQIVELAVDAHLAAIEWGGDVHVPHGNLAAARAVRRMSEDHGLAVSAYGSYYRPESATGTNPTADAVLDTAAELGSRFVRVWAGTRGSGEASPGDRAAVAEQLALCCDRAAERNLIVATEFHGGTLTDDVDSCLRLLDEVNRANLRTFWQPPNGMDPSAALSGLQRVRHRLAHLHVFHWWPDHLHRHALAEGADRWPAYLQAAADQSAADGESRYASLEFVRDDNVDQFRRDAATLCAWLGNIGEST
ncbi:MAG: TIM barrel protein [Tepidisphaeraceae bacterium]